MQFLSVLLTPLSWLYGIGIFFRNLLYDVKLLHIYQPSIPVISVGNLTVGGTGKTPFVEYLVKLYQNKGFLPCVISRGYKRLTRGMLIVSDGASISGNALTAGDEPYQIARKFPKAMVVVSEKRSTAADFIVQNYKPHLFILDDAFQHRAIGRNLDIVVIDGRTAIKEIPILPAGRRREHISALNRADLIIRTDATKKNDQLSEHYPSERIVDIQYEVKGFRSFVENKSITVDDMRGKRCVAFSGIGNSERFLVTLNDLDLDISEYHKYPDHYLYREKDIYRIWLSLETARGDYIVTTEKDAVRLESLVLPQSISLHLFLYVVIEAVITKGEEALSRMLQEKIDPLIV